MVKYWNILYANKLAKVAFKCVLIYTHTKKKTQQSRGHAHIWYIPTCKTSFKSRQITNGPKMTCFCCIRLGRVNVAILEWNSWLIQNRSLHFDLVPPDMNHKWKQTFISWRSHQK